MPLFHCEINLTLTWSANCLISNAAVNRVRSFAITDAKLFFLVVTLTIQDNSKLLLRIKS